MTPPASSHTVESYSHTVEMGTAAERFERIFRLLLRQKINKRKPTRGGVSVPG